MRGVALAVVGAAVITAGCGGDSQPAVTADQVSQSMTASIRSRLPAGATMDPLDCVRDGDDEHWSCIAVMRTGAGVVERMSVAIVCDTSTGKCVSRPT